MKTPRPIPAVQPQPHPTFIPPIALGLFLAIHGTFAAHAQSGDSLLDAHNLGALDGPRVLAGRVNDDNPEEYYRFEITDSVRAFEGLAAGASLTSYMDLALLQDTNGNNVVEDDEILDASQGQAGVSATVDSWLNPGVYFVRAAAVPGYDATYQLILSQILQPASAGPADDSIARALASAPVPTNQPVRDFVGRGDPEDFHRFEVTNHVHIVRAVIPKESLTGYVRLSLIHDSNGNEVSEDAEVLATATGYSEASAETELWLNPGTYFLRVDTVPNYQSTYELTLSQTPKPLAGGGLDDSIALAYERPLLASARPVADFVGTSDPVDFYAFEVTSSVAVVEAVIPRNSLGGYVILSLIRDDNQNGVVEDSEILETSSGYSDVDAKVDAWLDQGFYLLRVAVHSTYSSEYALTLAQSPKPTSLGLRDNDASTPGYLGHVTTPRQVDDYVGPSDPTDFYRFDITGPERKIIALLPKENLAGYITLRLLADTDQNGILEEIKADVGYSGTDALIEQTLGPGTYYLQVDRYTTYTTSYRLVLSRAFTGDVPPFLINAPSPQTVAAGKSATFTVQGDGSGVLRYQWYLDGQLIPGANSTTLTLSDRIAEVRDYSVNVRITSSLGEVATEAVRLQVTPADVALGIARAVLLSWPTAGTEGYLLQGAPTPNGPWTFLTNRPVVNLGNRREVAVDDPAKHGFYRLAKP